MPGRIGRIAKYGFAASLMVRITLSSALAGDALLPVSIPVEPPPRPSQEAFREGERMEFAVSWMGIPVGVATMEVSGMVPMGQGQAYHVVSTAKSGAALSVLYPVDDHFETFIDTEGLYSYRILIDQHEGRRQRRKEIIFDQDRHKAYLYKNKQVKIYDVPPRVQDSLSALYFFRTLGPFEVGKSVFIDVHESDKNWQLEIQVLGTEKVKTDVGKFDTYKLKALVKYEGLFVNKGDVYLWVTRDSRHIPVQMKSRIMIGSVSASLSSLQSQPPKKIASSLEAAAP